MPTPSKALISEGFFEFKKKASEGMCWVKGCHRHSRFDRCLCSTHDMRRWRAKKKKTADYCTLRDHAKARGVEFKITLDYWRGIVDAFGYYQCAGDEVMTIDRIDPTQGYVEGNLRVVTLSVNSSKAGRERYLPEHIQHMLERQRVQKQQEKRKYLDLDHEKQKPPEVEEDDSDELPENCPF